MTLTLPPALTSHRTYLALILQLCSLAIYAQSANFNTISGRVVDELGEPLIGVAVLRIGTDQGTTTDFDGLYQLEAAPTDSLRFSYVGYAPQIIAIDARSTIDVEMGTDVEVLQDVVVVGYRSEQRRATTGAISQVDFGEVDQLPVQGLDQALQGRAAGVQVTNSTGAPGDDVSVRIRGVSTVGSNSPLYVIDGVPVQGGINAIAPGDIASVTILKDAAASIYGSRASNGVVLITTKRGGGGIDGQPVISLDAYYGVQQVARLPRLLNTSEFIAINNEAIANTNVQREERGQTLLPLNPDNADTLPNVDWLGAIFRTAPTQNYRLGISGRADNVDYLISGAYLDQRGIIKNSGFDRLSFRANLGIDLRQNLRVGSNLTVSRTQQDVIGSSGDGLGGNGGGVVRYALLRPSAIPLLDENGVPTDLPNEPQFYGDAFNPVALLDNTDWNRENERLLGNVFAELSLSDALQLRTSFGLDRSLSSEKRFFATYGDFDRINALNSLTRREGRESVLTWTTTATFSREVATQLQFDGLLGVETVDRAGNGLFGSRQGFSNQDPNFRFINVGATNNFADEFAYASGLFSVFGQAKVGYKDRYYISGTLRRDGSSRFGDNNRYGYFPSLSVAWNLIDELWAAPLRTGERVAGLKLRASYGILGNQEIGDYLGSSIIGEGRGYVFGTSPQPARSLAAVQQGNPDVRWERNEQLNVGLDASFLAGAIQFSANAFEITTRDMLVAVPVPLLGGAANPPVVNAGTVRNRGLELEAGYRSSGAFSWGLSANASIVDNEVLDLGSDQPILAGATGGQVGFITRTEPGHPIGSFYLFEADGLFQTQEEVDAHVGTDADGQTRSLQPNAVPGDIRFVDRNGDGRLDPDDRYHAGSPIPSLTYGIIGDVSWRGFDANVVVQGVTGNEIYHFLKRISEDAGRPFNSYASILDRWTGPGTSDLVPRVTRVDLNDNLRNSTRFLEDGSYVRLKNVTVGYTLPETALKGVSRLRLYVSAFNLLTATKYTGLDPELGTNNNDTASGDLAVGIDWGTYPVARTYTFGINATL